MYSLACPKLQLGLYIKLPSQLMHSSITARTLTYQRYVTGTCTIAPAPMPTYSPAPWTVAQIVTTTTLAAITSTTKQRQITTQASNQPSPVCSRWVCNLTHLSLCPYPLGVCLTTKNVIFLRKVQQKFTFQHIASYQYNFPLRGTHKYPGNPHPQNIYMMLQGITK